MTAPQPADPELPIRLQVVGGGNGWWVSDSASPSSIATYVFVDVEEHPELLDLPHLAQDPSWSVSPTWLANGKALRLDIAGPRRLALTLDLDRPELEAVRRTRQLFVCPTTPRLGLDPYLARDRSFAVRLPRLED
jgi:hypothetical protein